MNQGRKTKDGIFKGLIYGSSALTVCILIFIIGFIFLKGVPQINGHFLTANYDNESVYAVVDTDRYQALTSGQENSIKGQTLTGDSVKISKNDELSGAQKYNATQTRVKVTKTGGGIRPMLVSTLMLILLSLLIAAPIGILSAVYLNEYAKPGKILTLIRFAIQNLAGIPSIIYGLFGCLVFVQMMGMQYSILAGALTISIILLPTMISTTEESLKSIPKGIRESSLGLGATKLQTIQKVVVPNALPGILVAVILSIGRIVGESAALLLTAGTVASIPTALTGEGAAAATLTIKAYTILKETGDVSASCGIGVVLIVLIICLNLLSKVITSRFMKKQQG